MYNMTLCIFNVYIYIYYIYNYIYIIIYIHVQHNNIHTCICRALRLMIIPSMSSGKSYPEKGDFTEVWIKLSLFKTCN